MFGKSCQAVLVCVLRPYFAAVALTDITNRVHTIWNKYPVSCICQYVLSVITHKMEGGN